MSWPRTVLAALALTAVSAFCRSSPRVARLRSKLGTAPSVATPLPLIAPSQELNASELSVTLIGGIGSGKREIGEGHVLNQAGRGGEIERAAGRAATEAVPLAVRLPRYSGANCWREGIKLGKDQLIGTELIAQAQRMERLRGGLEAGMRGAEIKSQRTNMRGIPVEADGPAELRDRRGAAASFGNREGGRG